jgi:hypothetical protein
MQDRALALMGKKLTAAQALEGKFANEGLVALAGEDANVELALARSLVDCMDEGDVRRHWRKVSNPDGCSNDVISPDEGLELPALVPTHQRCLFELEILPHRPRTRRLVRITSPAAPSSGCSSASGNMLF